LKVKGIKNLELINEYWGKAKIENNFDLVVCSYFLWMVEDLEKHLERIEQFSNRYCIIVQPCGRDEIVKKAFEEICEERYTGQFEPDADYFAYVILREWSSKAPHLSARRTLNLLLLFRFHRSTTIGTDKKSFSSRMGVFTLGEIINYVIGNSLFFLTL